MYQAALQSLQIQLGESHIPPRRTDHIRSEEVFDETGCIVHAYSTGPVF